jgi:two-component system chemotaxis response regulator CheY
MRKIIINHLKTMGFTTFSEAPDGKQALQVFSQEPDIQFILCDWNMPEMNGFDFLLALRKINKTVPFVMVTTESEKAKIVQAIQAGVSNYILKPFTEESFKAKIDQTLKKMSDAPAS